MIGFETDGNCFCSSCGLLEIYSEEEKKKGIMRCGFCDTEIKIQKEFQQCQNCGLVELIREEDRARNVLICGFCQALTPIINEEEYVMCSCGLKELIIEGDRERGYSVCGLCNEKINLISTD